MSIFRFQRRRLMFVILGLLLLFLLSSVVVIVPVLPFQLGYTIFQLEQQKWRHPTRKLTRTIYDDDIIRITTTTAATTAASTTTSTTTTLFLARDRTTGTSKSRYYTSTKTTANSKTTKTDQLSNRWYPNIILPQQQQLQQTDVATTVQAADGHDDNDDHDTFRMELEQKSVTYVANRIRLRLQQQMRASQQPMSVNNASDDDETNMLIKTFISNIAANNVTSSTIATLSEEERFVHGRFMDLTCVQSGEDTLERLLLRDNVSNDILMNDADSSVSTTTTTAAAAINDMTDRISSSSGSSSSNDESSMILRGAIMVLQSLCVMGTQVGVKGPPEQLRRMVDHLSDSMHIYSQEEQVLYDYDHWTKDSVRRLKYRVDRTPAIQLLAALSWKQTPQGAFDLLVALNVWTKHEDLALLRSGFPIRFTNQEEIVANLILQHHNNAPEDDQQRPDPDSLLGLRQDLRHLKVYTIDGADAAEIDDGISIEAIDNEDKTDSSPPPRHRIWIHIADAESYASPDSDLFEMARRRVTSLYLPSGAISMFPARIGTDLMSLKANEDVRSLSLGVEINHDGSLNASTIVVTPSLINVSYRLTYDEVDEMLEEGIGYNEEWEIGALLVAAKKRREFRIKNGSSEGMVPNPVPTSSVSMYTDENSTDTIGISINIEVSHNAAMNKTASAEQSANTIMHEDPASSAYLLVTEAMILAGEAIGVWKNVQDEIKAPTNAVYDYRNCLRLPFRTQSPPDFKGRARERTVMMDLLESNAGMGLCHAWYTRRFLESVSVKESPMPHSGLGLNSYVQWSSPIRRFSDLQVHAAVKRYIRRSKVYELIRSGEDVPLGVRAMDLGLPMDVFRNGRIVTEPLTVDYLDKDLDYMDGIGLVGAGKKLQRQSQQYWLFEYVKRIQETNPETTFNVVVLGCVDPDRFQFAIYVKELGLEHRYTSPAGRMEPGTEFRVKVDTVTPRSGLLSFVRVI